MSTDLRALLQELAEDAAPDLDALPAAQRLTSVRNRAKHLRRRRAAAAGLAVVALIAGGAGLVKAPMSSLTEPARPPQPAADVVPTSDGQRMRVAATAVPIDGETVHLVATLPDLDLQFTVVCPLPTDVRVSVTVNGHQLGTARGCGDHNLTASSVPTLEEFWTPYGVAPGRPMSVSISASTENGDSPVGKKRPFAYVGLYAAFPSTLPARPASPPSIPGFSTVATATLDADDTEVIRTARIPLHRQLWASVSCAGRADGLEYMVHMGNVMVARGNCQGPTSLIATDLTDVPRDPGSDSVVVLFILSGNAGAPLDEHPPAKNARVIVSILEGKGSP